MMMVIGTQAESFPATRFLQKSIEKRVGVAVVNLDQSHVGGIRLRKKDWGFFGDVKEVQVLFMEVLENKN